MKKTLVFKHSNKKYYDNIKYIIYALLDNVSSNKKLLLDVELEIFNVKNNYYTKQSETFPGLLLISSAMLYCYYRHKLPSITSNNQLLFEKEYKKQTKNKENKKLYKLGKISIMNVVENIKNLEIKFMEE